MTVLDRRQACWQPTGEVVIGKKDEGRNVMKLIAQTKNTVGVIRGWGMVVKFSGTSILSNQLGVIEAESRAGQLAADWGIRRKVEILEMV